MSLILNELKVVALHSYSNTSSKHAPEVGRIISDIVCKTTYEKSKGITHSKNILYWFIEGQINFDMPRGAKMSLILNELKVVALHSYSNTSSKHAPEVGRIISDIVCKTTYEKSKGITHSMRMPHWIKK